MNKIKVLWFGLVPLGWWLSLQLIIWITNYPINWNNPSGLGVFLTFTGVIGTLMLIFGALGIAIYLQE